MRRAPANPWPQLRASSLQLLTSLPGPPWLRPLPRSPSSLLHRQWSMPPKGEQALSPRAVSKLGGCPTDRRIISISGDGGFLFCAHELETAVCVLVRCRPGRAGVCVGRRVP